MEEAIFISKTENLKYVDAKYRRLYFGNEFCQRKIPSSEEIASIKEFILRRRMQFTLVTPFVTDEGIESLMPVLKQVVNDFPAAEIVANDWGVLRLLKNEFSCSSIVLGRLLTKQKRGPRILNLKGKAPQSMLCHFQESNVDAPLLSGFLADMGVKRVELDNLLQGLNRQTPCLKASLYFPFAYVTTTRFCLTAYSQAGREFSREILPCDKPCGKYTFSLRHKSMPVDLLLKGNTQFFENKQLPDNLESLNIDRIVYEPEIPL